jgi:hypothetical protein
MGLFTNPLGYAGYPPRVTGTPETQPAAIQAATLAEAEAGTIHYKYISPATLSAASTADFASPPPLGSVAPNTVAATTLSSSGNTSLGTGASSVLTLGSASSTIGFFGATPVVIPTSTTDLRTALINLGLYTTGGASPLNLNGGALTAGALTATGASTIGSGAGVATAVGNATGTLGFFGSAGATKVSQGAITNSVTAGGSTGTIANYTDLTVYANDAAAIRNDIYQLSLALANVVGALRSYGLLV